MKYVILLGFVFMALSCTTSSKPSVNQEEWGSTDSKPVYLFTLTNSNGITAEITNYGATLVSFNVPDKDGKFENIVLGLDRLESYLAGHPSLGCVIGRYANRIGNAKFILNGTEYTLAKNNGENHIHGGVKRFSHKVWDASISSDINTAKLSLICTAADMEEGYPGNMVIKVDYVLNNDNELVLNYSATTDKPTVINLTNHSYFNLTGCKENVLGHQVKIYADAYTPVDEGNIPTGEIRSVAGTEYDLREWTTIGDRLSILPKGYDNNYCLKGTPNHAVLAAELYEPKSGRLLQTFTTEPGVQFYTSCNLDGSKKSPSGVPYSAFMGACFEAQHYPDSPNKPDFPSTTLNPGETYTQVTTYKVGIK
ncbi:MAG: galactose mutarotase [Bacteroidales bacterium]|jgi:aldose 1-epimerase|nr:galactose mutarotase [Bacteroidales bacterium]